MNTVDGSLSSSIDDAVSSAMELSGSTEAVVGVWSGDGDYVRGYGDGIDGSALIRGAQATQPVMCALLLDLVDQGHIDLDREITDDLTRQSGIDGITYAQLCTMTSGLADYKYGEYEDTFANNPTRPWAERELIAQGLAKSPRSWKGLNMYQSDTNMVVLERVLKVEEREDISDLLDDHVFSPLDMNSTYFPESGNTISGTTLNGITYPSSGGSPVCDVEPVAVPEVNPSMLSGAGATVTTVTDLKNFYEAYVAGTFGGDEAGVVTTEIPTKNPERDDDGNPTEDLDTEGRQWTFGMEKSGPLYGRVGSITGTITAAYHDPTSGYSVVVALNNSSAGAAFIKALAFELAAISADAGSGPELTWTADEQRATLEERAVCQ